MSLNGNVENCIELRGSISLPETIHGKTAYEIAVYHGFDGTEEEWLAYLEGAQSEAVKTAGEQAQANIKNDIGAALSDIAEAKATMLSEIEIVGSIVQTTGNSETAVMSQKAVTDEFDAKFKTTIDTSSVTVFEKGWVNGNNGAIVGSSIYNNTDYIDIGAFAGGRATVTSAIVGDIGFAIYDKDNNFIVGYNNNSEGITTNMYVPQVCKCNLPDNACYVRFTLLKDGTIDNYPIMCEIGNVSVEMARINAELNDARIGGDDTVYDTVGEAIRGQIAVISGKKLDKRDYQEMFVNGGNIFPIKDLSGLNITLSGVTVTTDDESGVLTLNGTATTANSIEIVTRGTEYGVVNAGEKYLAQLKYMSGECSDFANGKPLLLFGNITSGNLSVPWVVTDNSVKRSIEPSADITLDRLAISITAGVTYTNLKIAPYLALETDFDNGYAGGEYKFCASNLDIDIEKIVDEKVADINDMIDGQLVSYMKEEAERVNVEAITEGADISFLAFADPHLFDADKYMKYGEIMKLGGLDFLVGLGDYAPYAMSDRKTRLADLTRYLSKAGRGKDCFYVVGNHEDDKTTDGNSLTRKELHRCLCSHLNGVVHFNDLDTYGCYYYVDYDVAKIRVIILNTSDMYDEAGTYTNPNNTSLMMHQRQLTWFANKALNFENKNDSSSWSVLTFGHTCWPFGGSPLQVIMQAVKNGATLNQTWTVGDYTLSVNADYSIQGAVNVIGMIMGHSHNDVSEKLKDINCIQLRADNNVLDIPYTVAVNGLTAGSYFITADNGKKYGCTISTDYPAAKFISYNYSTVVVSKWTQFNMLILDENKLKLGEVTFKEADYNASMTELTGFVAQRTEGTATTESCYIINVNKDDRTITAIPYGVGCEGVVATY